MCGEREREKPRATAEAMLCGCAPLDWAIVGDSGCSSSSTSSASRSAVCAVAGFCVRCQRCTLRCGCLRLESPYSLLFFLVDVIIVVCLGPVVVAIDVRALVDFVLCQTATLLLVLLLLRLGWRPYEHLVSLPYHTPWRPCPANAACGASPQVRQLRAHLPL